MTSYPIAYNGVIYVVDRLLADHVMGSQIKREIRITLHDVGGAGHVIDDMAGTAD